PAPRLALSLAAGSGKLYGGSSPSEPDRSGAKTRRHAGRARSRRAVPRRTEKQSAHGARTGARESPPQLPFVSSSARQGLPSLTSCSRSHSSTRGAHADVFGYLLFTAIRRKCSPGGYYLPAPGFLGHAAGVECSPVAGRAAI